MVRLRRETYRALYHEVGSAGPGERKRAAMEIRNKTVLVTGANRGIGLAFVEALVDGGAACVYAGTRTIETPPAPRDGRVRPLRLDVTDEQQIGDAVNEVEHLDLLINNAGVLTPVDVLAGDMDDVARDLDVNYFGLLKVTRAFLPRLEESGGAVINILTLVALASMPGMASYSSSKAAAFSLTQGLRTQLASRGVAVHGVFPGAVDTDMLRGVEMPKTPAADVARATLAAFEAGEEDIFPDPMSRSLSEIWRADPKELERQLAAMAA